MRNKMRGTDPPSVFTFCDILSNSLEQININQANIEALVEIQ